MSCGWLQNPEEPWASGGSWAEPGLAGVVAESVFLSIVLAGWWWGLSLGLLWVLGCLRASADPLGCRVGSSSSWLSSPWCLRGGVGLLMERASAWVSWACAPCWCVVSFLTRQAVELWSSWGWCPPAGGRGQGPGHRAGASHQWVKWVLGLVSAHWQAALGPVGSECKA